MQYRVKGGPCPRALLDLQLSLHRAIDPQQHPCREKYQRYEIELLQGNGPGEPLDVAAGKPQLRCKQESVESCDEISRQDTYKRAFARSAGAGSVWSCAAKTKPCRKRPSGPRGRRPPASRPVGRESRDRQSSRARGQSPPDRASRRTRRCWSRRAVCPNSSPRDPGPTCADRPRSPRAFHRPGWPRHESSPRAARSEKTRTARTLDKISPR